MDMVLNVMAISESTNPSIQLYLFTHILVSCSEAFYFILFYVILCYVGSLIGISMSYAICPV